MTRAAATRSGSRVTVPATQSMYDGSKAAIWPSVWPWNLPNSMTCARARPRGVGGFGRRKLRSRPRSSGPVGVDARGGSRPDALAAQRRLAGRRRPARRCGPPGASADDASGCVAGTSGARVDPAGQPGTRSGRRSRRPAAAAARRVPGSASASPAARLAPIGRGLPGQRRIRVVDLGHPPRGDPRGRRIVAGQVRVVRPSEPPPGGLDLAGWRRARHRGRHEGRVSPRRPV